MSPEERTSSDECCLLCGAPAVYAWDAWGGVCCSSSAEECPLGGVPIPKVAWEAMSSAAEEQYSLFTNLAKLRAASTILGGVVWVSEDRTYPGRDWAEKTRAARLAVADVLSEVSRRVTGEGGEG